MNRPTAFADWAGRWLAVGFFTGAEVPVSSNGFTAMGKTVNITLNFAPAPGTQLMVVQNTGPGIIRGTFSNLAQGQTIAIPRVPDSPYCPVNAVLDWMAAAGIEQEALFRRVTKGNKLNQDRLTDQSVARVIKRLAARAGLMASQYAGHSLRSGF